ncbi:MAG: FAD-binding protein [Bryobacteraceae bacterium]
MPAGIASGTLHPATAADLADALGEAAAHLRSIQLCGRGSKQLMAGPIAPADIAISTNALNRVIAYEPNDLTISVEAGMSWSELTALLASNRQMIPLDPPFSSAATAGGIVASNCNGPRRRLYGTARDFVIGMTFATLEGKLVETGGMVVKNVAGLDVGKLMIGSFGTLAAIASVNFKLAPMPEAERGFLLSFADAASAIAARNRILQSSLQPVAIDLLNLAAGATLGKRSFLLAIRVAGNAAAVERYEREFAPMGDGVALEGEPHETLWTHIREFTPVYLSGHPSGAVVRASCTLKGVEAEMASFEGPAIARAASGVCYGYFEDVSAAMAWRRAAEGRGSKAVIEFAPETSKPTLELWPAPAGDFEIMRRVKNLFDPSNLLNRGRLYGRI